MIGIGVNLGGPEQVPIEMLLRATMQALSDERGPWIGGDDFEPAGPPPVSGPYFEIGSAPAVNVIFYIPGSILRYDDLEMIEAARFSRKRKLLLVAVPVPREQVESGGSVEFVIDALHKAVAIAAEVFAQKSVGEFDLTKAEAIIDKVRQTLEAQALCQKNRHP